MLDKEEDRNGPLQPNMHGTTNPVIFTPVNLDSISYSGFKNPNRNNVKGSIKQRVTIVPNRPITTERPHTRNGCNLAKNAIASTRDRQFKVEIGTWKCTPRALVPNPWQPVASMIEYWLGLCTPTRAARFCPRTIQPLVRDLERQFHPFRCTIQIQYVPRLSQAIIIDSKAANQSEPNQLTFGRVPSALGEMARITLHFVDLGADLLLVEATGSYCKILGAYSAAGAARRIIIGSPGGGLASACSFYQS